VPEKSRQRPRENLEIWKYRSMKERNGKPHKSEAHKGPCPEILAQCKLKRQPNILKCSLMYLIPGPTAFCVCIEKASHVRRHSATGDLGIYGKSLLEKIRSILCPEYLAKCKSWE
jgi:hypothetical protein